MECRKSDGRNNYPNGYRYRKRRQEEIETHGKIMQKEIRNEICMKRYDIAERNGKQV